MSRRKNDSTGLNLDSLLDTLTNVVGFLVILLALMQLGVGDAVERIREKNPEAFGINENDIKKAREKAQALTILKKKLEEQKQNLEEKLKIEKAALSAEMAARNQNIQLPQVAMSIEEVRKLIDQLKKKIPELETQFANLDKELARITALLDKTPDQKMPAGTFISLPDPHPVDEGYEPVYFFCKNNRLICMNLQAIQKAARDRIVSNKSTFRWKDPNAKQASEIIEYDGKKITDSFNKSPLISNEFKVKIRTYDQSKSIILLLEAVEGSGETKDRIVTGTSKFRAAITTISSRKQKKFAQFLVHPDSFDIYLEARAIANKYKIPAGWHILYGNAWSTSINQPIQVHQMVVPPPPPPGTKTQPRPPPKLLD